MSSDSSLTKNLNYTELQTIGELVKASRNAHLKMLDENGADAGQKLLDVLRVLFFEAKGYADGEYGDLLAEIRYQNDVVEQQNSLNNKQIEDIEKVKDRIKSLLDDAGLSIEQEQDMVVNAADNGFEVSGDSS